MKIIGSKLALGTLIPLSLSAQSVFLKQDANIRVSPSLSSEIVITYKKNTPVEIIEKIYTKNNGTWYQIEDGYISAELIKFSRKEQKENSNKIEKNPLYVDAQNLPQEEKSVYIDKSTQQAYTILEIPRKKEVVKQEISLEKKTKESKSISTSSDSKPKEKKYNKYFIESAIGFTHLDAKKEDIVGSITPTNNPDENGISLEVGVGYNFTKKDFFVADIQYRDFNDIEYYNYLFSYNRRFAIKQDFNLFGGVVGGYSTMKLTNKHITSGITDAKGSAFAIGLQGGLEQHINKDIDLFAKYQYLKSKSEDYLNASPAQSKHIRDHHQTLSLGLMWGF